MAKTNEKSVNFDPIESQLWKAADKLHKKRDVDEYKQVVLSLIFLKYTYDSFEILREKLPVNGVNYTGADSEDKDSPDILVIRPNPAECFALSLYWFFSEGFVKYSDLVSGGTSIPRKNWEIITRFEKPQSNMGRVEKLNLFVNSQISKIMKKISQAYRMEKICNDLLSNLMSAKLRILL